MRLLQLRFGKRNKINGWANPVATLVLLPLAVIPILASLFLIQNNAIAILVYLILVVAYLILYMLLVSKVKLIALRDGKKDFVDSLNHIFTPKRK